MADRPKTVVVNDLMQKNYRYELVEPPGKHFDPDFTPDLTPKMMLELGVFGGRYMTDCRDEFPEDWFKKAKLNHDRHVPALNYFGVLASQPLWYWRLRGWIHPDDPRGWFQWYCRYFMGRRMGDEDSRQIARWKKMQRHVGQLRKNCPTGDVTCRRKQRQALLQWAYDSRNI